MKGMISERKAIHILEASMLNSILYMTLLHTWLWCCLQSDQCKAYK